MSKDALKTLKITWPLLCGIGMIMTGVGLQSTLLSLRAELEGFPIFATGLIMSAYYLGFLIGSISATKYISSVGHIRVFAAFASLASTTILFHGLFVNPWIWAGFRFIAGIGFAGLFIVAESWLNSVAPNKLRGQIFTYYIFVLHGGLFLGQFLIGLTSIEDIGLFIAISVLVSLSLVPVTLADKPSPGIEEPETLPFKKLLSISPLSICGVLCAGLCGATFLTLGPIYAQKAGLSTNQIAVFIGSFIAGAGTIPLFIGKLSDHMDRRKIITATALIGIIVSLSVSLKMDALMVLIFLFGGLITSLYSVCVAFINDFIPARQITSATSSLVLLNGIGSAAGPFLAGFLIQHYGEEILFSMFAFTFTCTFLVGSYRMITGQTINIAKQKIFRPMPVRAGYALMKTRQKNKIE